MLQNEHLFCQNRCRYSRERASEASDAWLDVDLGGAQLRLRREVEDQVRDEHEQRAADARDAKDSKSARHHALLQP